jgi:PAS domain S-box-containing protein
MVKKPTYKELEKRIRDLECASSDHQKTRNILDRTTLNYQAIFDGSNDAIFIYDAREERILGVNQKATEMFGYTKEELLQLDLASLNEGKAPYSMADAEDNFHRAEKDEESLFEWKARKKNGDLCWVEVNLKSAVLDGEECIIEIVRDINTRKETEIALKSQRDRLEYILEGSNAGTWEWDVQTGELTVNKRWLNTIGYTTDKIPQKIPRVIWSGFIHPADLEQANAAVEKHLRGESDFYEWEFRMQHKDGHWVWILDRGKVVSWGENGKPLWIYGTHQEITQRKQAEEKLAADAHQIQESNTALRVLLQRMKDDQQEIEKKITTNIRKLVLPYLEKLRGLKLNDLQANCLETVTANLQQVTSPFLQNLATCFADFTPREIQVANMIREGKTSKEIAHILNTSIGTVDFHRDNIRKKLALSNKKSNLRTFLMNLS